MSPSQNLTLTATEKMLLRTTCGNTIANGLNHPRALHIQTCTNEDERVYGVHAWGTIY